MKVIDFEAKRREEKEKEEASSVHLLSYLENAGLMGEEDVEFILLSATPTGTQLFSTHFHPADIVMELEKAKHRVIERYLNGGFGDGPEGS